MLTGSTLAIVLGLAVVWAVAFAIYPHFVDYGDDRGDGLGRVILPKPAGVSAYRRRTFAYFIIGAALSVFTLGLQRYQPGRLYANLTTDVASNLTSRRAEVQGYLPGLSVRIQLLWVVAIISFALVVRADLGRKAAIALHAALYLLIGISLQAFVIALSIKLNVAVIPSSISAVLINTVAGVAVSMRIILTTFALPKPNALRKTRRFRATDAFITLAFLLIGLSLPLALVGVISKPAFDGSEWRRFTPMLAVSLFWLTSGAGLLLLRPRRRHLPAPLSDAPPIDVITPAYNEEAGIAKTLESVDRAAARYSGRVRAIVSNDGSTDGTKQIALETMKRFKHAEGMFIDHYNTGKAGALNRALQAAEAEIIVRLDGDCILDEAALRYTPAWFDEPSVGIVGSRMLPREDCTSWYAKMRGIEVMYGFGCTRMGQQVVDGVGVVPGTFTAFRRQPMLHAGGFVDGMNGEDSDQTCQFGRMNYRVVIDPRIVCYEDVPASLAELMEQRTRWSRANIHTFMRHNPLRNGMAGPRVWFYMYKRGTMWSGVPVLLLAPIYYVLSLTGVVHRDASALYLVTLPLVLAAVGFVVLVGAAARYRYWKVVVWYPTYLAFSFLRRCAFLEGMLSLPTRPLYSRGRPGASDSVLDLSEPYLGPQITLVRPATAAPSVT